MAEVLSGWKQRAAARQAVRRSGSGYAALRAVGLGLGAVLATVSAASMAPSMLVQQDSEALAVPPSASAMTSLTIRAPRGDVTVAEAGADGRPQVLFDKRWTLNEPSAELTDNGDGSWSLATECTEPNLGSCEAGLDVLVPAGTDVTVIGSLGDVDVRLTGVVDVRSAAGDITVEGSPTEISATTAMGNIHVESGVAPASVTVRSTAGDIDLLLPRSADYDVLAETDHGDRSVTLPTRSGAPHTVSARTTFGNVDLAPTG